MSNARFDLHDVTPQPCYGPQTRHRQLLGVIWLSHGHGVDPCCIDLWVGRDRCGRLARVPAEQNSATIFGALVIAAVVDDPISVTWGNHSRARHLSLGNPVWCPILERCGEPFD